MIDPYPLLEKFFLTHVSKGVVLSVEDLMKVAKKKKSSWKRPSRSKLRHLRKQWKFIAMHSRYVKPSHFMTNSFPRYGVIMLDFANFQEKRSRFNQGNKGFIVGVECVSQKLACVPCKDKTRASWKNAISDMLQNSFPRAHRLITDRDTAVTGKAFQQWLKETYKVDISFLRSRSKAFLSERMIRFLKERLSIALKANALDGDKNKSFKFNWIQFVPDIVQTYNREKVTGTNIKRVDVDHQNFWDVLKQKWKAKEPLTLMSLLTETKMPRPISDAVFKYDQGQKVMLARDANYKLKESKFKKRSVTGSFGPEIYTISNRRLKSSMNLFLTPVYSLKELSGLFYESELNPVYLSDQQKQPKPSSSS